MEHHYIIVAFLCRCLLRFLPPEKVKIYYTLLSEVVRYRVPLLSYCFPDSQNQIRVSFYMCQNLGNRENSKINNQYKGGNYEKN